MSTDLPLVSVVLSTHDRPEFLPIALRCFAHQTYQNRELLVVDDSIPPVDEQQVVAAGGRLIRVDRGSTLGMKLNRGAAEARGELIQKMDDDDWKGPRFMARMVAAYLAERRRICRPTIAGVGPFFYFDLQRWEIRRSPGTLSQASIMFSRLDWADCPFRPIPKSEDMWFFEEQRRLGAQMLAVRPAGMFLQVRHQRHEWELLPGGERVEDHLLTLPLHRLTPEALLPPWAVEAYRSIQKGLL